MMMRVRVVTLINSVKALFVSFQQVQLLELFVSYSCLYNDVKSGNSLCMLFACVAQNELDALL